MNQTHEQVIAIQFGDDSDKMITSILRAEERGAGLRLEGLGHITWGSAG